MRRVLVVDAANVVGSVPDGWWRDRPRAAARLHAGLPAATPGFDEVVLVLEGRAVAGVPSGAEGRVVTVHAAASGDDEIVARCTALVASAAAVSLASADRGLLARVEPLGVTVVSPRALRLRLG